MENENREKIKELEKDLKNLNPTTERYYETLLKLSKLYRKSESYQKAESLLEEGKKYAKKYKFDLYLADIYRSLSFVKLQRGNVEDAQESSKKALLIVKYKKGSNAQKIKANIYALMGNINFAKKLYKKALEKYKKGLKKAKEVNFKEREITIKSDIANVHLAQYNYTKAKNILLEIKSDAKRYYNFSVPSLLLRLARIEFMQSNYSLSEQYTQEALDFAKEIGSKSDMAQAIEGLGRVYLKQGYWKRAKKQLDKANKIFKEIGFKERRF